MPYSASSSIARTMGRFSKSTFLRGRSFVLVLAVLVAALQISGCAAPDTRKAKKTSSEQKPLIWPLPPATPRIAFVNTIEGPWDIGARKGFLKRFVEFLVGAKEERIIRPFSIAVDSTGRILVSDTALKRIHIFDTKKKSYSYITGSGKNRLEAPMGIATDSHDRIYVADSLLKKVFIFNRKGRFLNAIEGFERPTGVAVNKKEDILYVVDTAGHHIKIMNYKGDVLKTLGKHGDKPGEFNYPVDVFVDGKGDIYVTDTMNFRVQVFDKFGNLLSYFGRHGDGTGDMGRPKGLGVDSHGNIYVADAIFDTVQIFDRKGNFLLNFGTIGREPGRFWMPAGLFVDEDDKIYVADSYNRRIQIFEYLGVE